MGGGKRNGNNHEGDGGLQWVQVVVPRHGGQLGDPPYAAKGGHDRGKSTGKGKAGHDQKSGGKKIEGKKAKGPGKTGEYSVCTACWAWAYNDLKHFACAVCGKPWDASGLEVGCDKPNGGADQSVSLPKIGDGKGRGNKGGNPGQAARGGGPGCRGNSHAGVTGPAEGGQSGKAGDPAQAVSLDTLRKSLEDLRAELATAKAHLEGMREAEICEQWMALPTFKVAELEGRIKDLELDIEERTTPDDASVWKDWTQEKFRAHKAKVRLVHTADGKAQAELENRMLQKEDKIARLRGELEQAQAEHASLRADVTEGEGLLQVQRAKIKELDEFEAERANRHGGHDDSGRDDSGDSEDGHSRGDFKVLNIIRSMWANEKDRDALVRTYGAEGLEELGLSTDFDMESQDEDYFEPNRGSRDGNECGHLNGPNMDTGYESPRDDRRPFIAGFYGRRPRSQSRATSPRAGSKGRGREERSRSVGGGRNTEGGRQEQGS